MPFPIFPQKRLLTIDQDQFGRSEQGHAGSGRTGGVGGDNDFSSSGGRGVCHSVFLSPAAIADPELGRTRPI